jgi:putative transposase
MNHGLVHTIPGTTFANVLAKGDYNPGKHAVLTQAQLKAVLTKWICDDYHTTVHSSTGLTPRSAWERHIAPQDIPMLPALPDMTQFIGYLEPSRVVSENGIQQNQLQYNSPALKNLRDRYGDKIKVEIRWDSADLGKIWVMHPEEPLPIEVPALDFDYAHGLSLYQHKAIRAYMNNVKRREDARSTRLEAKLEIAEMVREATIGRKSKKAGRTPGISNLARFMQGGDGEPLGERSPEALPPSPPVPPLPPPASSELTAIAEPASGAEPPQTPRRKAFTPIYKGHSEADHYNNENNDETNP